MVDSGNYGVEDSLQVLLLGLVLCCFRILTRGNPALNLIHLVQQCLLVALADLPLNILIVKSMLDAHAQSFKSISGLHSFSELLVLIFVFFCFFDELLNFLFGKTAFVVGDCDLGILVGSLVSGLDVHDSVLVDLERYLDLRDSSWSGGNASEVELAEKVVVFGHLALSFEDLDEDSRLVVTVGREYLRFLCGDGCISWD